MEDAVFGLFVILGIAVANLFFGFSLAVLFGQAPRSWGALLAAVEFRTLELAQNVANRKWSPPRLPKWKRKPKAAKAPAKQVAARADGDSPHKVQRVKWTDEETDLAAANQQPVQPAGPAPMVRLAPLPSKEPVEELPYDVVLEQQLAAWREGELSELTTSAVMLAVTRPAKDAEGAVRTCLLDAVRKTIVGQVRRDRQIVSPSEDRFVWFLDDVEPEDAVMPVERIRQVIEKTAYRYQEQPLDVAVQTMVVIAQPDDTARQLLNRLEASLQFALRDSDAGVVIDLGDGPIRRGSLEMEIPESELVLDESVSE